MKGWDVEMFEYYQNELKSYINEINYLNNTIINNRQKIKKLNKQIQNLSTCKSENTCVICLDNISEFALIPCGHVCVCKNCKIFLKKKCPICNTNINNILEIFFS